MLLGASLHKSNFYIGKDAQTGEGIVEEHIVITLGIAFMYVEFSFKSGHIMKLDKNNFTDMVD